jgi:hypothetical protein
MHPSNLPVTLLRVFLATLFAFLLVFQLMSLPGQFAHDAQGPSDLAYINWILLVVAELGVLCVQVVIVCTWQLLTLVRRDRIFSEASLRWVDGIVGAFVVGWLLLAGLSAYLVGVIYFTPELRDPGVPILLFGAVLIGAVLVLLMLVLRTLLRQATALRADMDVVI